MFVEKKFDYNKKKYIEELYRKQKARSEYQDLSKIERQIIEQHFNESLNGTQNISFLSTYECARRLGVSDYEVKIAHQKLRELKFIVITDVLVNGNRPNYGYVHQLYDLDKEYYFDNFHPKNFTGKLYLSRINKGGILERNCCYESSENRRLRLAGERYKACGVEISDKQKAKNERFQQRHNPQVDLIEDENSKEIEIAGLILAEEDQISKGFTLQKSESSVTVVNVESAGSVSSTSLPSTKPKRLLPTENAYYKQNISSQNSIWNRMLGQIFVPTSDTKVDEWGEELNLKSFECHGVFGYAYVSPSWSKDYQQRLVMQNWAYNMMYNNVKFLQWNTFMNFPEIRQMYWLESHGLPVQRCMGKVPIYDKYFPNQEFKDSGEKKEGTWSKLKFINAFGHEWGINISGGNYVILDFDSIEDYCKFTSKHPVLGNSFTIKTNRGYHVYLYVKHGFKKFMKERKSLFGIKVDCKMSGFVRFSECEVVNAVRPLVLPYEIYLEWCEEPQKVVPQSKEKVDFRFNQEIPIGYRRTESWRILRGIRHKLSYEKYLEFAENLYQKFEQSEKNYYSRNEHAYNVKRAWSKPNRSRYNYVKNEEIISPTCRDFFLDSAA